MMEGLLLIDKPAGMTSFDVVRQVRRVAKTRKVGHTGTLDPDATGLLCVALGRCTKLAKYLQLDSKSYEFEMRLGSATDTDDSTGEVIRSCESHVTRELLDASLPSFLGTIDQVPPKYSAIHVDGRRAHELARAGEDFELAARPVLIKSLEVLDDSGLPDVVRMRMSCGSGTYVRSLTRDLAEVMGTCGHTAGIRRLNIGPFQLENAIPLAELTEDTLSDALFTPREMLASMPEVQLDEAGVRELSFGRPVPNTSDIADDTEVALITPDKKLAAVGVVVSSGGRSIVRPRKVLLD